MWQIITSLVLGAVPSIVGALAKAKVDMMNATTEHEKVEISERIKALESRRDVLIAESRTPWNQLTRAAILAPLVIFLNWTTLWDKIACKWFFHESVCTTDPLSAWQAGIFAVGLGYLFLDSRK